jgi:hypothetical protein
MSEDERNGRQNQPEVGSLELALTGRANAGGDIVRLYRKKIRSNISTYSLLRRIWSSVRRCGLMSAMLG